MNDGNWMGKDFLHFASTFLYFAAIFNIIKAETYKSVVERFRKCDVLMHFFDKAEIWNSHWVRLQKNSRNVCF